MDGPLHPYSDAAFIAPAGWQGPADPDNRAAVGFATR